MDRLTWVGARDTWVSKDTKMPKKKNTIMSKNKNPENAQNQMYNHEKITN